MDYGCAAVSTAAAAAADAADITIEFLLQMAPHPLMRSFIVTLYF